MISVDTAENSKLRDFLQQDGFPVIAFTSKEIEDVSMELHHSSDVDSYVALSHVWQVDISRLLAGLGAD